MAECTVQKMFPINDFFSKCDQIRSLKKPLNENFIFCAVINEKKWTD